MKAGLVVALALLLWIPQGISVQTQPVVTGHSTFLNGDVYDQCLASVAGILRSRVMWFNDQVLVERYPGKGNWVYLTEKGGKDPTKLTSMYSDGVTYNFVDPNGAAWHVEELYTPTSNPQVATDTETLTTAPNVQGAVNDPNEINEWEAGMNYTNSVKVIQKRQYVWAVEIASTPIHDDFPGDDPHTLYNFLLLVDTCKFNNNTVTRGVYADHTNVSILNDRNGHPNGDSPHGHETWQADIYVGKRPRIVPAGADTDGAEFQSQWVTSDSGQQNTANAAQNNADQVQRRTT